MSRYEKAIARLLSKPTDYHWSEVQMLMKHFRLVETRGSGSKRKFLDKDRGIAIGLHEPHPRKILKRYAIEIVIEGLRKHKLI